MSLASKPAKLNPHLMGRPLSPPGDLSAMAILRRDPSLSLPPAGALDVEEQRARAVNASRESLFYKKGAATAAAFRPHNWTYETFEEDYAPLPDDEGGSGLPPGKRVRWITSFDGRHEIIEDIPPEPEAEPPPQVASAPAVDLAPPVAVPAIALVEIAPVADETDESDEEFEAEPEEGHDSAEPGVEPVASLLSCGFGKIRTPEVRDIPAPEIAPDPEPTPIAAEEFGAVELHEPVLQIEPAIEVAPAALEAPPAAIEEPVEAAESEAPAISVDDPDGTAEFEGAAAPLDKTDAATEFEAPPVAIAEAVATAAFAALLPPVEAVDRAIEFEPPPAPIEDAVETAALIEEPLEAAEFEAAPPSFANETDEAAATLASESEPFAELATLAATEDAVAADVADAAEEPAAVEIAPEAMAAPPEPIAAATEPSESAAAAVELSELEDIAPTPAEAEESDGAAESASVVSAEAADEASFIAVPDEPVAAEEILDASERATLSPIADDPPVEATIAAAGDEPPTPDEAAIEPAFDAGLADETLPPSLTDIVDEPVIETQSYESPVAESAEARSDEPAITADIFVEPVFAPAEAVVEEAFAPSVSEFVLEAASIAPAEETPSVELIDEPILAASLAATVEPEIIPAPPPIADPMEDAATRQPPLLDALSTADDMADAPIIAPTEEATSAWPSIPDEMALASLRFGQPGDGTALDDSLAVDESVSDSASDGLPALPASDAITETPAQFLSESEPPPLPALGVPLVEATAPADPPLEVVADPPFAEREAEPTLEEIAPPPLPALEALDEAPPEELPPPPAPAPSRGAPIASPTVPPAPAVSRPATAPSPSPAALAAKRRAAAAKAAQIHAAEIASVIEGVLLNKTYVNYEPEEELRPLPARMAPAKRPTVPPPKPRAPPMMPAAFDRARATMRGANRTLVIASLAIVVLGSVIATSLWHDGPRDGAPEFPMLPAAPTIGGLTPAAAEREVHSFGGAAEPSPQKPLRPRPAAPKRQPPR